MRAKQTNRKTLVIRWILLSLAFPFLMLSCSKESDITTSNDYCYISSVTLGNVKLQTKTINTTYSASEYEMTINQRTGTIENRDSLPYGSLLSRVLATITFDGSVLKYRTNANSEWTVYNSEDSLDLTKQLELQLTSNDNLSNRTYFLKVNVHKQEGDSLYWKQCNDINIDLFASITDIKVFVLNDKLMALGQKGTSFVLLERSGIEAEGTWEENTTDLPAETDLQTLRQQEGMLYLSTSEGKILTSNDAKSWTQTGSTHSASLMLVEKTGDYFYAISEGKLLRSADATTWEEDNLDSETAFLPTSEIRALTLQQANGYPRIVMIGLNNDNTQAFVWNKMWNVSEKEKDAKWIYFPLSPDNTIPCPKLHYLNLLPYDGKCIAFGGASMNGKRKALDAMYISHDYGITWRPDAELHMPFELYGVDGCITSTVDKNNFIWILTNAQVWRGRLNKLGFAQQ